MRIYVGSTNGQYALNAQTGAKIWSFSSGVSSVEPPAVVNGVAYFTSGPDTLYAVNATNGTILNRFVTGAPYFGSPAVSDGVVYTSALGGNTYAFSLTANTDAAIRRGPPPPSSLHPDFRLPITH